jgi:hypothetical protein
MSRHREENIDCNLCGLSCALGDPDHPAYDMGGLINARVSGGYESTPGNGRGALDDCTSYSFSLCEFCLDWLFMKFKKPVQAASYTSAETEVWQPAVVRVVRDDWRKMKDEFCKEAERRAQARSK